VRGGIHVVRSIPTVHVWIVMAVVFGAILFGSSFGFATTLGQETSSAATSPAGTPGMSHEAMIEAAGAQVMPFDQNKTTHVFQKTDSGGVESVVAKDPADQEQIGLIRAHLAEEARKFRQGNYEDPAKIHGMDMPGLKELAAGYSRVDVRYEDLPDGGRITYSSSDPALVAALHAWFDRQLMDHGENAQAEMPSTPAAMATPQAPTSCDPAMLVGAYGHWFSGSFLVSASGEPLTQPQPYSTVGVFQYDGAGNVSGADTINRGGAVAEQRATGTYTVNADCTGSETLQFSTGKVRHNAFVVIAGGRELRLISTDPQVVASGQRVKLDAG
jgi:hypothetical protein